jgi:hypothetical protein
MKGHVELDQGAFSGYIEMYQEVFSGYVELDQETFSGYVELGQEAFSGYVVLDEEVFFFRKCSLLQTYYRVPGGSMTYKTWIRIGNWIYSTLRILRYNSNIWRYRHTQQLAVH